MVERKWAGLCLEGTTWTAPWRMRTKSGDGKEDDTGKGQDLKRL